MLKLYPWFVPPLFVITGWAQWLWLMYLFSTLKIDTYLVVLDRQTRRCSPRCQYLFWFCRYDFIVLDGEPALAAGTNAIAINLHSVICFESTTLQFFCFANPTTNFAFTCVFHFFYLSLMMNLSTLWKPLEDFYAILVPWWLSCKC